MVLRGVYADNIIPPENRDTHAQRNQFVSESICLGFILFGRDSAIVERAGLRVEQNDKWSANVFHAQTIADHSPQVKFILIKYDLGNFNLIK